MNENKDFVILNISIFVVSDSRNQRSDKSGKILEENILESGHQLEEKKFVTDDKELIIKELSNSINKKEISFDIYKRASEKPIYRISKNLNPKRNDERFFILDRNGNIIKRSEYLETLIRRVEWTRLKLVK